jgi:hypothetical protein
MALGAARRRWQRAMIATMRDVVEINVDNVWPKK